MSNPPQEATNWWWLPGCLLGVSAILLVQMDEIISLFSGESAPVPVVAIAGDGVGLSGGGEAVKVKVQGGLGEPGTGNLTALPALAWSAREEAFLQAQQVFLASGDNEQARAVAQEMEEGPARVEAWRRLVAVMLEQGQVEQAGRLVSQVPAGPARDQLYETLIQKTIDLKYGADRLENPLSEPLSVADFDNDRAQAQAWLDSLLKWTRAMSDSPVKVKRLGQMAGLFESVYQSDEQSRGAAKELRREAFEVARRTEGPEEIVALSRQSRVVKLVSMAVASAVLGMVFFWTLGSMLRRVASVSRASSS